MKKNRFVLIGLLLFFLLCLVPTGQAQSCFSVSSTPSAPWQVGLHCTFTSTSSSFAFRAPGVTYWQIFFVPSGTVSAATLSVDSSATGATYSTGGVIPAATIGAMTSVGSYTNSSATTPTEFAQLTPTITGSGQVIVTVFGYNVNPNATGSVGGTVAVSSLPALVAGSAAIGTVGVTALPALPAGSNAIGSVTATQGTGSNLHTAVDSLPALPSGTNTIGNVGVNSALPAGSNTIGNVGVNSALPVGTNAIGTVASSLSAGAPITGQQAVTASAVALPTTTMSRPVCLYALPANALTVYFGPSGVTTSTGFPLAPGASMCGLTVSNLNQLYVIASSTGSSVAYSAQ